MSVAETSLSHCWHVTVTQEVTAIGQGWTVDKGYSTQRRCRWHVNENETLPEQNSCYGPDTDTTSQCVVGRKCKWGGATPTLSLFSGSLLTWPRRSSLTFDGTLERNLGGIVLVASLVPSSRSHTITSIAKIHSVLQTSSVCFHIQYCTNFFN